MAGEMHVLLYSASLGRLFDYLLTYLLTYLHKKC